MASSNWKAEELCEKNPMVAEVLDELIPIIAASTKTAIELGDQLCQHRFFRGGDDIDSLSKMTTASAFVRYVFKETGVAATEVISHHKKKDDENVKYHMRHIPVTGDPRPYLLKRAKEFAKISTWARSHIGKLGASLITTMTLVDTKVGSPGHSLGLGINVKNNYTILVHGFSELFGQVFQETLKMMERKGSKQAILNFICTDERSPDTNQLRHSTNLANGYGIPLDMQFQLQHASMAQVDMVFVEAAVVYMTGIILSAPGTPQIAEAAASASIPVYVLAEGHKFSSGPKRICLREWEFTPPDHLKKIVSNEGIISPSSVSGAIENQYAGLLSA